MTAPSVSARPRLVPPLTLLVPLGCLLWAFWTTLADLALAWKTNPQYSHGYLVPGFALFLLWLRRQRLDGVVLRPSMWGLPLLAAGAGLRLAGTYYYYVYLDAFALLPCLAGLCLLLGGWAAWRWAWPALLFLAFMIPVPWSIASALSDPLQRLATVSSTFVMQVLGLPALAEGNVILLNDHQIGIVEACNGLRMMVVFFALATAVVLVTRRPLVDKLIILASAVPIALVSNILRVTVTGILYEAVNSEAANAFFHDAAGWLMMPVALGLLAAELKLLSRLFLDVPPAPVRAARIPSLRQKPRARGPLPARPQRPARPPVREPKLPPAPAEQPTVEKA